MAKKCKYCYSAMNTQDVICNFCKIDTGKNKKDLSKEEKKIVYYCSAINIVAFLAILGGVFGVIKCIGVFSGLSPKSIPIIAVIIDSIFACLFIIIGFSLKTYQKWAYIGSIVLFGLMIFVGILSLDIIVILVGILYLSYVAAPTSKKILYRKLSRK